MTTSRRLLLCAIPAAGLALLGCNDHDKSVKTAVALPDRITPSVDSALSLGQGFTVGNLDSQREVVVFFDPLCSHCAYFWKETRRLHKFAKFTWLPVNALSPEKSLIAASDILSATDKVAAMDAHAMEFGKDGRRSVPTVTPREVSAEHTQLVERNRNVWSRMGASGVPYYVAKHEKSGLTIFNSRTMAASSLALELGWDVPVAEIE